KRGSGKLVPGSPLRRWPVLSPLYVHCLRSSQRRTIMVKPLAVVAVGGNALIQDEQRNSIPDQYVAVMESVQLIVEMVEVGWDLVLTHGNGPQVGFILRRSELASNEVSPVPLDYAVGDTQGAIGYMFQKALHNELARRGI